MEPVREGIWRFSDRLPPVEEGCKQTFGEGGTPLLRLRGTDIWVKVDCINPTSSFKDRGVAFLISKIVEEGARSVVIDSSGNAAVSTAAYCARAGIGHIAVMPRYSHVEKKAQVLWHGSRVLEAPDRDAARRYARRIARELGLKYIGFALEPLAVPGFRTVAYEMDEHFTPDAVFVPAGSGTNIVAIGGAYLEMGRVPEVHCVQSAACAPISGVFTGYTPIESTLAEGVIVPVTERRDEAVRVVRETGGTGWVVDDADIHRALRFLASNGVYASPTGSVGVAGALKAGHGGRCVCIVTGSGLKSNLMLDEFKGRIIPIDSESELEQFIEEAR
ncbi:MAG: pyridoxal-phosphate dependent enzyme [Candidatus Bathyarchaeota archaeon]|nr:pyridoxal-phosphate dependent enzyme [Candidatus Bathyarchaeota archaeon]